MTCVTWLRLTQCELVEGGEKHLLCYENTMGEMVLPHVLHQQLSEWAPLTHGNSVTQNLLEMLNLRPRSRPTASEILGIWPSHLYF